MRQLASIGVVILLAAGMLSGCAGRRPCPYSGGVQVELSGPLVDRGEISPDKLTATADAQIDLDLTSPDEETQYRPVTAEQCKCLAAAAAPLAELVAMEGNVACSGCSGVCGHKARTADMMCELLSLRAAEERNRAAGEALELFYLLAEAEYNRDAIQKSLEEMDRSIENVVRLKKTGMEVAVDEGALRRERTDLLSRREELRLSLARLNGQLRRRLGLDVDDPTPLWPNIDLAVTADEIDVDKAVSQGMGLRADLAAIQTVCNALSVHTLPAVRSALKSTDALLGSAGRPALCALLCGGGTSETSLRREQVNRMLVDRQRAVAEEIRQAVHTIQTRVRQVALAKRKRDSWKKRLDNLKQLQQADEATAFDVSEARLKLIEAEGDLVHQAIAWQIARVKLSQAQGMLAFDCGYTEPDAPCPECGGAADDSFTDPSDFESPPAPVPEEEEEEKTVPSDPQPGAKRDFEPQDPAPTPTPAETPKNLAEPRKLNAPKQSAEPKKLEAPKKLTWPPHWDNGPLGSDPAIPSGRHSLRKKPATRLRSPLVQSRALKKASSDTDDGAFDYSDPPPEPPPM